MSALELARRVAREQQDGTPLVRLVPYAAFLGVQIQWTDSGPRIHLPYRESLIGNRKLPALHGGVTAAFMENAALLHLLLQLDETRVPKSINFAIDYLLPGRAQDCWAECEVSRAGLRVAQTQIRCWQQSRSEPIALARAHFLLAGTE